MKLEQLERLRSEDSHDYPYHGVILDPKSKEDKVKVTNFKNSPKFQIFEFWNGHTFLSCLIRCANMKWIRWVLLKIQSGHDSVHRRTDRQTDKVIPVYPPFNFVEVGGIKIHIIIYCVELMMLINKCKLIYIKNSKNNAIAYKGHKVIWLKRLIFLSNRLMSLHLKFKFYSTLWSIIKCHQYSLWHYLNHVNITFALKQNGGQSVSSDIHWRRWRQASSLFKTITLTACPSLCVNLISCATSRLWNQLKILL